MSSNWYQRVREPRESYNQWQPTAREVIDHIFLRRIRNNQNVVGAVCGETGSGKSWTALKIGEMVDPSFGIDSIVFSAQEFLESFETHSRGEVVVYDEGQEWSARRAMSKKNVEMSDILTMLRFTQVNILFTVPNINLVDVNLRRLMHIYLDVRPVDRVTGPKSLRNKSIASIYMIRHRRDPGGRSEDMGRPFPVVPIVRGGKKQNIKVDSAQFLAPSPSLVEAYERKKRQVFHERLHRAVATLGGPSTPPAAPVTPPQVDEDLTGLM
ncbi:MAG: zonular occludens toxin domain-containing protein [Methanomicrobiaceae archaeon]|nr:zonular occludens toxin domain-containing protein [Methanomicrobiaceae archaeon]